MEINKANALFITVGCFNVAVYSSSKFYEITFLYYCSISVAIPSVWIGNSIYLALTHDYTLQITVLQRLVFPVTVFTALLVNVFQQ
jgi:hypothetical protein